MMPMLSRVLSLQMLAGLAALPSPALATDNQLADLDKKICRSDVPTGSHFPKRVCHTRAEWKTVDAENEVIGRATNASRSGMQMEPFANQRY
jgi:hypothetical protein